VGEGRGRGATIEKENVGRGRKEELLVAFLESEGKRRVLPTKQGRSRTLAEEFGKVSKSLMKNALERSSSSPLKGD